MEEKKPYYYWRGEPLTKFEYIMLRHEIIADYIVEDRIEKSKYAEANFVIDKIKKTSYNSDK
jgi:hypothetical protein